MRSRLEARVRASPKHILSAFSSPFYKTTHTKEEEAEACRTVGLTPAELENMLSVCFESRVQSSEPPWQSSKDRKTGPMSLEAIVEPFIHETWVKDPPPAALFKQLVTAGPLRRHMLRPTAAPLAIVGAARRHISTGLGGISLWAKREEAYAQGSGGALRSHGQQLQAPAASRS